MIEITCAIAASTLFGLLAFEYRRYEYWRAWAGGRFTWGVVVYVLGHAAIGALAGIIAIAIRWKPVSDSAIISGVIFAAAGQTLARVQPAIGFGLESYEGPNSLLSKTLARVVEMLDYSADRAIRIHIAAYSRTDLIALVLYLFGQYVQSSTTLAEETKQAILSQIVAASEDLEINDDSDAAIRKRSQARGVLEAVCLGFFVDERLLPPMRVP